MNYESDYEETDQPNLVDLVKVVDEMHDRINGVEQNLTSLLNLHKTMYEVNGDVYSGYGIVSHQDSECNLIENNRERRL